MQVHIVQGNLQDTTADAVEVDVYQSYVFSLDVAEQARPVGLVRK